MAVAASVIYTVIDESGDTATHEVQVPNGFSIAQYTEFASDMATLIDAILSGKLLSADFCVAADISALTGNTVGAASDVEEVGAFLFRTDENRPVLVNGPGINETMVLVGSDEIDQTDTDIAAFLTAMEDGLSTAGGTIAPTDVGEDDIISTEYARERFRATGRRS